MKEQDVIIDMFYCRIEDTEVRLIATTAGTYACLIIGHKYGIGHKEQRREFITQEEAYRHFAANRHYLNRCMGRR